MNIIVKFMNILIAPDSFKGSLSANRFIDVFSNKLRELKFPAKIMSSPLADGGEGSLEVIIQNSGLEKKSLKVYGPHNKEIKAWYLYEKKRKTAYIEMAKASGLMLADDNDVMHASSFGTGQLMKHAIENGSKKIILFVGGSATNDAGTGIANALGVRFQDVTGKTLRPIGKNLVNIHSIDDSKSLFRKYSIGIIIAADVNNPFYGTNGAAYIYSPQKGATENQVVDLDKGLQNIAAIFNTKYYIDVQKIKGSGAAGGIGGGMLALFNAKISSGSDLIFKLTGIEKKN